MTSRRSEFMGDSRTSNAGCNGDAGARLKAIALDDLLAPLTQYVTFAADLGESRDGTVDVLGFVGGREPYTDAGFACGHHREGEADNGRASTALGGFLTLALLPPPDASHRPLHALVRLPPRLKLVAHLDPIVPILNCLFRLLIGRADRLQLG
jgi:hypothetical protein